MNVRRRVALECLVAVVASLGWGFRRAAFGAVAGGGLTESDRRLASLGRRLAVEEPVVAARLARAVAREVTRAGAATPAELARRARSSFLDPDRVRRDVARGSVVAVDGWVLARSEAAVGAYLHRLQRHGR